MSAQSPLRPHEPATFVGRGVAVPFTTPMLAGGRVRAAAHAGLELLLPNPSGGRGTYILPLANMRAVCRPTVYDIKLTERIAGLCTMTPASIRVVAKQVAVEGFAGRAAGLAAEAALAADRTTVVVTNFNLLLRLVDQEEPGDRTPLDLNDAAGIERRAKRTIAAIAPRLNQTTGAVTADLEQLAALYAPIGLTDRAGPARLPQALERLRAFLTSACGSLPGVGSATTTSVSTVVGMGNATLAGAERTLADARANAAHVTSLLQSWQADRAAVTRDLARTDWLLDGWDRVCALWQLDPEPAEQHAALEEIAASMPVLPQEALTWDGIAETAELIAHGRPTITGHADWRTGLCIHDTIARNEGLLAA